LPAIPLRCGSASIGYSRRAAQRARGAVRPAAALLRRGHRPGLRRGQALASGEITPGEAAAIAQVIDSFTRTIDISDLGWRLEIAEGLNAAHSLALD